MKLMAMSLLAFVAMNLCLRAEETHTKDSLEDVKKAVAEGKAVLVDVREKAEWDDGHLKGALSLPLSALKKEEKAPDNLPKDKPVYVHCAAGARALVGSAVLKKFGLDARALKPGFNDLKKEGFPVDDAK